MSDPNERTAAARPPVNSSPPEEAGSAGPKPIDDGGDGGAFGDDEGFVGTAQGALAFLTAHLGLAEDPDGSNSNFITTQFFEAAERPPELAPGAFAWCAATVSMALNSAWGDPLVWRVPGVRSTYVPGTAYVPALRMFFEEAGRFDKKPQVGDVMIYGPDDPEGSHTGMVEEVLDDGTIVTLEGNWANALVRERRSLADIVGFGHPPYSTEEEPFMSLSPEQQEDLINLTRSTNAAVGRLEVAIRDQTVGLQAQVAELKAKIEQLEQR